ncbi:hypothetical protein N7535_006917 [Penicillium sp. DV-2018c]|nr:hypothetical protein N7461_006999 [Penicillium sp. DV-2018c]KAJ5567611.1 hypothetical protein N7535_006917 [Penicillium sp. DV-2018c]
MYILAAFTYKRRFARNNFSSISAAPDMTGEVQDAPESIKSSSGLGGVGRGETFSKPRLID